MADRDASAGFPFGWLWPPQPLFSQPIPPQWSFGSVTINQHNSSSPTTEMQIVAENSYGRQLGKVMDAMIVLAQASPHLAKSTAIKELLRLHKQNEDIKTKAAQRRLKQLRDDLARLKAADETAFETEVAALRRILD